jgi:hypothetical protein
MNRCNLEDVTPPCLKGYFIQLFGGSTFPEKAWIFLITSFRHLQRHGTQRDNVQEGLLSQISTRIRGGQVNLAALTKVQLKNPLSAAIVPSSRERDPTY